MSEAKDPAIMLFGKTIKLPEIPEAAAAHSGGDPLTASSYPSADVERTEDDLPSLPSSSPGENHLNGALEEQETKEDPLGRNLTAMKQEDGVPSSSEELIHPNTTLATNENSRIPSSDNVDAIEKMLKTKDDQSETSNSEDMIQKKPDKILPCPRCNSVDTKFCYYNNYNVNQPRHFCKNCQRYWTAGGTMRNVPVGAGRRKTKNTASHYRQITVSEALQRAQVDLNGIHQPNQKQGGAVLTFGCDTQLCKSMASALNIAEKTMQNCSQVGFHYSELKLQMPITHGGGGVDNGDDLSSGSSVTAVSCKDGVGKTGLQDPPMHNCQNFATQVPCFSGAPCSFPWNPAQWNSHIPPTALYPAGFPIPVYPIAPYWGCTVPGTWTIPLITPPTSQNNVASTSAPNSPTLGKHSRDDNAPKPMNSGEDQSQRESNSEKSLWIPKTLRIDDPEEAARSTIWATLGIKHNKGNSVSGGLLKSFQLKGEEKNHVPETPTVLQANSVAFSRSLNFQESS